MPKVVWIPVWLKRFRLDSGQTDVVVLPFGGLGEIHEVFIIQCLLNSFIKEFSDSGGPVMHGIIYYYIIKYNINYIIINININIINILTL